MLPFIALPSNYASPSIFSINAEDAFYLIKDKVVKIGC